MAPIRVIFDSDDEEGEFSPIKAGPLHSDDGHITQLGASTADAAGPAGAVSLQNDHEAQQEAGTRPMTDYTSMDVADSSVHVDGLSATALKQATRTTNSSSITDPTAASRRSKKGSSKELLDLTQVTTPGKDDPSAQGVWDVPASPGPPPSGGSVGTSRSAKTYSKRKRNQRSTPAGENPSPTVAAGSVGFGALSSAEQPHGPDLHDGNEAASPMPARKRRKQTSPMHDSVSASGDVDLFVVPQSEEGTGLTGRAEKKLGASSDIVPDTLQTVPDTLVNNASATFYIAPSRLTNSQKREYKPVACSSENEEDGGHAPSAPGPPHQEQQRSSGDATIAYPTPSRYCSSIPMPAPLSTSRDEGSVPPSTRQKRSRSSAVYEPTSSPDIISAPTSRKGTSSKGTSSKGTSSKGKGNKNADLDDSWDSNEIGYSREQYLPRASRRRSSAVMPDTQPQEDVETGNIPDVDVGRGDNEPGDELNHDSHDGAILISSGQEPLPEAPKQKKRGRKKKEASNKSPVAPEALLDSTAPTKRKRGRPRKSDLSHLQENAAESLPPDGEIDSPAETGHTEGTGETASDPGAIRGVEANRTEPMQEPAETLPKRRGRKKKVAVEPTQELDETATENVLGEISNNAESPRKLSTMETTPESKAVEGTASTDEKPHEDLKKPAAKDMLKETLKTASSQASKVGYRVGLSKRTRIAPLLKSLRK